MYDFATYFAWFVIAILFFVVVAAIVAIGSLPKRIAVKRNHPQVDAINAASWISLAFGGLAWPIAFVWAFLRAGDAGRPAGGDEPQTSRDATQVVTSETLRELRQQMSELRAELASLKRTHHTPS